MTASTHHRKYNKKAIIERTKDFVKQHGLMLPVDLNQVAELLNTTVLYFDMPDKLSGHTVPLVDNSYMVLINRIQSANRMRFSIAHELGHIFLGHDNRRDVDTVHQEANIFAAELLMPSDHISHLVANLGRKDIRRLAEFYFVSEEAIKVRLQDLGMEFF